MNRFLPAVILVLCLLASCSNPVSSVKPPGSITGPSTAAVVTNIDPADTASWSAAVAAGEIRAGAVLAKISANFNSGLLASLGAVKNGTLPGLGGTWVHLSVPAGTEPGVILALRKTPGILAVEPELLLRTPEKLPGALQTMASASPRTAVTTAFGTSNSVLSNPYVNSAEYSLSVTQALAAYNARNPANLSTSTYAAVIDTGLNFPHEAFHVGTGGTGNSIVVLAKSAFYRNSSTSYTYVGDDNLFYTLSSADMVQDWDDVGHGTHVTGILGALGNNGGNTAGVLWNGLNLISYKVLTDNETDNDQASGSDWVCFSALGDIASWWTAHKPTGTGAQVTLPVNMSLGGFAASNFDSEMIASALQNNVVLVTAMGNEGKGLAQYPAAYSGVIAVGATMGNDILAPFSSTGSWISVVAPGYDIVSSFNGSSSDYEYESGTSMAAPFVTGLAAYALAFAPGLSPDQLKTLIMESADLVDGQAGFTSEYGAGRVNVAKTLSNSAAPPASGTVYSAWPITVTVDVASNTTPGENLEVYLYDQTGNFVAAGYTGSDSGYQGIISFYLLPPGTYTAKVNDGNSTASGSITLVSGATGPAALALTLAS